MYDELIKDLRDWPRVCVEYTGSLDELHDEAANAIEVLDMKLQGANAAIAGMQREIERMVIDSVNSERKTGGWCADYDGYSDGEPVYDMWWCSACGEYFDEWDDRPTWKYCPNCGAKMIGGDEDV